MYGRACGSASASQPAQSCEHGVTPGHVEAEIVRLTGNSLFGELDRDALVTVGVDVDAVRATTEASLSREALTRAAGVAHRKPPWFDLRPRSGAWRDGTFLPHGPGAGQALVSAVRQALVRHATQPADVEDLALGVLAVSEGLVPVILSGLGVSGPAVSAAIKDRYQSTS